MYQDKTSTEHIPVLLAPVLQYLDPREGDSYLDLTGGYGGHAAAILTRTGNYAGSVLVDRDPNAIKALETRFAGTDISLIQADFLTASRELLTAGKRFDLILADLGVSSPHLNLAS